MFHEYVSQDNIECEFLSILNKFKADVFDGTLSVTPDTDRELPADVPSYDYLTSEKHLRSVQETPHKSDFGDPIGKLDVITFAVSNWSSATADAYNPYSDRYHKEMASYLAEKKGRASIVISGSFLYHPICTMPWHTNESTYGDHAYLTYVDKSKKSYFRYYDNETKEIITSYDEPGWQIRYFNAPKTEPYFWHCTYTECPRISIGFRILYNL